MGRGTKPSGVHVALLRGINVGGKSSLPMKPLAELFVDAGCDEVRTYIQSGNVLFRATEGLMRRLPEVVSSAIADRHGLDVPVVTRSLAELRAVAGANPFISEGADPSKLHVAFLAGKPGRARVASLDPDRSPPDQFEVRGRELFLHCPKGLARSKLTNAYFDSKLAMTTTIRTWRTALKLIELGEGL